jgi:RNA 3'-terminal phosphate cyclase (ATP)
VSVLVVDGSMGEGGGQVLRTTLGLSLVTGRAVRIENVRARREKPGLRPQHATAVTAAARVGGARVLGNTVGSRTVEFEPSDVNPGVFHFDIGTAGASCLVLQTILPALMLADAPSRIVIEGGTYNTRAPSLGFLEKTFLPVLSRFGPRVTAHVERHGFYPAGGGRVTFEIEPVKTLSPLELLERGEPRHVRARAIVARLPRHVAERELAEITTKLRLAAHQVEIVSLENTRGPGNAVEIELAHENVTEIVTEHGRRGLPAERVAALALAEAEAYLASDAPVGPHLADQLLIPCALAQGGTFRTLPLTLHSTTNAEVIQLLLGTTFRFDKESSGTCRVAVTR